MELKDYVKIIGKRFWLFFLSVIVIVVGTIIFTVRQPDTWDASLVIDVVKNADQGQVDYYQYDKYYAIQSSSFLADTIVSWFKDPSIVMKISDQVNIDLENVKLKNLSKLIKAKKMQSTAVQITYNHQDKAVAQSFVESSVKLISDKVDDMANDDPTNNFEIVKGDTAVVVFKPSLLVNTLISLVVGIFIGLVLVFSAEYFASSEKK